MILRLALLALFPLVFAASNGEEIPECYAGCRAEWDDDINSPGATLTNPGGGVMTIKGGGSPGECDCPDGGDCAVLILGDGEKVDCDIWAEFSFNDHISWNNVGWVPHVETKTAGGAWTTVPVCAQPAIGSNKPPSHKIRVQSCGSQLDVRVTKWRRRHDDTLTQDIDPDFTFTLKCGDCDGNCPAPVATTN